MKTTRKIQWVAAALWLLCACEGTPNPCAEGVYDPGPPRACVLDGSVMLLDDGGMVVEDAGPRVDAGDAPDASMPTVDAGPVAPVMVVALGAVGGPLGDLQVLFHDELGTLVADLRTDGAGSVASPARPIGSVTLVFTSLSGSHRLSSVVGPQPGERITFDVEDRPTASLRTTAGLPGEYAGASTYQTWSTLDQVDSSGELDLGLDVAVPTDSVVSVAFDPSGTPIAYTASIDGSFSSSSFYLPDWANDFEVLDVALTGAPAGFDLLQARVDVAGSGHQARVSVGPLGADVTLRVVPVETRATYLVGFAYSTLPDGFAALEVATARFAPHPSSAEVALDATPWLTSVTASRIEPELPELEWTIDDRAETDVALCVLNYNAGATSVTWQIAVSPDATGCAALELPSALMGISPAGAVPRVDVYRLAADDLRGWAEVRLRPEIWRFVMGGSRLTRHVEF